MAKLSDFKGMLKKGGKIVFISYNPIKELKSGSYAGGQVVILANDIGRAILTTSQKTIDKNMDKKLVYDAEAVISELELLNIDPEKATEEQQFEALRNYADKAPGLREEVISERALKDKRAERVMVDLAKSAEDISKRAGLFIVYAGLHAFEQAVSLAKKLRTKGSKAVILSCSCSIEEKREMLNGTDIMLLDCECGGESTMGMLAKCFITNFQTITKKVQ